MVGIDPESDGLRRAAAAGLEVSAEGVDWIVAHPERLPDRVRRDLGGRPPRQRAEDRGCRTAVDRPHPGQARPRRRPDRQPRGALAGAGRQHDHVRRAGDDPDGRRGLGGSRRVAYAEIVATVASRSAGPGTRESIDAFTRTTAKGLEEIGGAERGKAIIILNPADPPLMMRDTVFCALSPDADRDAILDAHRADAEAASLPTCPGYRLRGEPLFDEDRVAIFIEVEGAADYLPAYAGNLDIMTAAAVAVAEELAKLRIAIGGGGMTGVAGHACRLDPARRQPREAPPDYGRAGGRALPERSTPPVST